MKNYKINENILIKESEDEIAFVDLEVEDDTFYVISDIGVVFWKLLNQDLNTEEIAQKIHDEYNAPKEQIIQDLAKFIDDLYFKKVLVK